MRATKPSSQRKHSVMRDCQSCESKIADTMLAHKTVRSKDIQTDDLKTNHLRTTDIQIRGQTDLPDDWNEQLQKHFMDKGKTFMVPRIVVDSAVVQNMLYAKNNVNVENLVADGTIDARGNLACFGTAHFYGPVKIHGSFEVDQVTTPKPVTITEHMTEPLGRERLTEPLGLVKERSLVVEKAPQDPYHDRQTIPVTTFQCKQMIVDEIRTKESIETKRISSQRSFSHSQEVKELVSETIQTNQLLVDDAMQCRSMQAIGIRTDILEVDKELEADYAHINHMEVSRKLNASFVKTPQLQAGDVHSDSVTTTKAILSDVDMVKGKVGDLTIKKSLQVHGQTTFTEPVGCQASLVVKDRLTTEGSFSLQDRIEAPVGRPIQMKQTTQFHRPVCFSNYQYIYCNTPQSSTSKPFKVDIHEDATSLIIDSDVSNVLALELRLPSNPVRGQLIVLSTNPSISTIQLRASIPILNAPTSMSMGSFVQFMYVEQPNKWFRTG